MTAVVVGHAALTDLLARVQELLRLPDGWGGPRTLAPAAMHGAVAAELLRLLDADGLVLPGVFPLLDGGVTFEWCYGGDFVAVEFYGGLTGYGQTRAARAPVHLGGQWAGHALVCTVYGQHSDFEDVLYADLSDVVATIRAVLPGLRRQQPDPAEPRLPAVAAETES